MGKTGHANERPAFSGEPQPQKDACASCGHDCPPDGAAAICPHGMAEKIAALVLPLLPDHVQEAEIAVAVPARGPLETDGYYVSDGDAVNLDLGNAAREMEAFFRTYPEELLNAGFGPTNVYIAYLKKGEAPLLMASYDSEYGGRLDVQEVCAGFEKELARVLPEKWASATLRLLLDEDGEMEMEAACESPSGECDLTEALYPAAERLEALFSELRLCSTIPQDTWNLAEFLLKTDGEGELQLCQADFGSPDEGGANGS